MDFNDISWSYIVAITDYASQIITPWVVVVNILTAASGIMNIWYPNKEY